MVILTLTIETLKTNFLGKDTKCKDDFYNIHILKKDQLHSFWWLKSKYVIFNFDYYYWRLNPIP